jgi:hypothetical protein
MTGTGMCDRTTLSQGDSTGRMEDNQQQRKWCIHVCMYLHTPHMVGSCLARGNIWHSQSPLTTAQSVYAHTYILTRVHVHTPLIHLFSASYKMYVHIPECVFKLHKHSVSTQEERIMQNQNTWQRACTLIQSIYRGHAQYAAIGITKFSPNISISAC